MNCYLYYHAIVLTTVDPSTDSGTSGLSIRGAAAGIGRGVKPTGVFGWMTGDRLRRVWLVYYNKALWR